MDLITELRGDLRAENMNQLWAKHGRWVVYAAVSAVVITGGLVYASHHRHQVAMEATAQYMNATRAMLAGNHAEAVKTLDAIALPETSEFYSLVLTKKAQALRLAGQVSEAAAATKALAERSDIYGDIGKLLSEDGLQHKAATPLAHLRLEWQAWQLVDAGKTREAAELFGQLAGDKNVLASQRERAEMMSATLSEK